MKAALLKEPGNLEIGDNPDPGCPQGGVLVQVQACGLCSSDAKMFTHGHQALTYPRIPGHEITGIIAESTRPELEPGLRVQVQPGLRCGQCLYCLRGDDHQCLSREIFGFSRDGGFAELLAVPLVGDVHGSVQPLPDNLGMVQGTLAEPLACCLNAQEKLGLRQSDHVLIIGGGPLGLLHTMAARTKSPEMIILSDPEPARCQAAWDLGVDVTLDPAAHPGFAEAIGSITRGHGLDVVILACAEAAVDESLLSLMARGGRISMFSGPDRSWATTQVSMSLIHYKELQISGAYGCRSQDNKKALEILSSRPHSLEGLIEKRVGFNELVQGLEAVLRRESLKTVLQVDHG
jgi:L-iditol 2-dehydrogenase